MESAAAPSGAVLIAGAGPTGLTVANALARYGTPFVIVDQKAGPTRDSKALAVNVVSQYGFDLLGLEGVLGKSGSRMDRLNILWQGRRLSGIDFRRLDFHVRSFIGQPQSDTEHELIDALERQGHRVAWRTRVLDVSPSDDGVDAVLESESGERSTRRFAYVAGCDGKNSVVRQRMGVELTGHDYPMHFVLGDFVVKLDADPRQVYYHVYEERFFIFVPVSRKYWRVVVKHDGPMPETPIRSSEITEVVERYVGRKLFDSEPVWISRAPFYMRTCDKLRDGRLFIAGDAAHLFSPIGGTGMNTGMQDALNLAWKLACRVRGDARDALLDSYEIERLEAIKTTAAVTDKSTLLISRLDKDEAAVDPFLPVMRNRKIIRSVMPVRHSGLALSYSRVIGSQQSKPVPGSRRAGELCLTLVELMAKLGNGRPAVPLVAVAHLDAPASRYAAGLAELEALQAEYSKLLRCVVFASDAAGVRTAAPGLLALADEKAARRAGAAPGSLLLVLPDGIIGYSGPLAEGAPALRAVLAQHFVAGAGQGPAGRPAPSTERKLHTT